MAEECRSKRSHETSFTSALGLETLEIIFGALLNFALIVDGLSQSERALDQPLSLEDLACRNPLHFVFNI